jgi:hypothetical protein
MRKTSNLTLGIFQSLYCQVNLDAAGEGFGATCTKEEAEKLVKNFIETATRVVEMISIDML